MKQREKAAKGPPMIERVVDWAMRLSQPYLADYGAARSRHDFTQRQLMTCLVLRAYLKTTYRGVLEILEISPKLRERIGLQDKLPHFTTLQKFSGRSEVLAIVKRLIGAVGQAAWTQGPEDQAAAMDSTGLAITPASGYFRSRSGQSRRSWVKLSVVCLLYTSDAADE